MEHEDDRADQDIGGFRRGGSTGNGQHGQQGIDHSISPGVPCPQTVPLAVMSDGGYLLVGYPHGLHLRRSLQVGRERNVTEPSPKQDQPDDSVDRQATYTGAGRPGRVSVKSTERITATVVVKTSWGQVRISIVSLFTWEAIMDPVKVDELMHVLGLAREEATRGGSGRR